MVGELYAQEILNKEEKFPSLSNQPTDFSNYAVTRLGMRDGLPQSTVNDIIQTRDGYLWMATFGGIVRFDGHTFTVFNKSNLPGLYSDRNLELYEDLEGGIWIFPEGNETLLQRYKEGKIETYTFPETSLTRLNIAEDDHGTLWLSAFKKMFRFTKNGFKNVGITDDPLLKLKAREDTSGVWFAFGNKLMKTLSDSVVLMQEFDLGSGREMIEVTEYPKNSGTLYLGTVSKGIFRIKNGEIENYNTTNGLPDNYFVRFVRYDKDQLIALLASTIGYWNGNRFEGKEPLQSLENISYRSIIEDNEGNFWVGTNGDGLYKLRPTPITMIDRDQGLANQKMLSITERKNGNALLSTNCGGIYEWNGEKATKLPLHKKFDSQCNWAVYEDSNKNIWIGSIGVYNAPSTEGPVTRLGEEVGFKGYSVFGIFEDSQKHIWVLSAEGIFVKEGDSFRHYTTEDGLYYNDSRTIFEDSKGNIWIGSHAGLNRYKKGSFEKISLLSDNRQQNALIEQPSVRAIYEDQEGAIWVGTYGNGLFRIHNNQISNVTKKDGLFDDIISHIVEDEFGYFWMGSNRGISRVSRQELNQFLSGEVDQVQAMSFGTREGMNSAETNGGFYPSTYTDSRGKIYFPTVEGVAVVDPSSVEKNETPPSVYIENLRSNETEYAVSEEIELPYDTPFLDIKYTAISFSDPSKVEFKYRMKGLDDSWISVGGQRSALYSKIPPGEYEFQVIASNNDGVWNETGASVAIMVVPPFWGKPWFQLIVAIFLMTVGPSFYFFRVMKLKRENERKKRFSEQLIESQEQERRRIARELHDGLGQQILVIKNRAELAQNQIDKPEEIANQLKEIMMSAMSSIGDVRNISHNLRPVHLEKFGLREAIINLCDQLQRTSSIDWSYHVDEIDGLIPKDKEINFYRIIQEAINNVLKHSGASEASVIIKKTITGVNAVIMDDGEGFNIKQKDSISGLGLLGMEERMESLAGKLNVESSPKEGTSIRIFIPSEQYEKTV